MSVYVGICRYMSVYVGICLFSILLQMNQTESQSTNIPSRKRSHSEINGSDSNDHRFHNYGDHHLNRGRSTGLASENGKHDNNRSESIPDNGNSSSGAVTDSQQTKSNTVNIRPIEKSQTQVLNEIYVNLVAEMVYPKVEFSSYGFSPQQNRYPFDRVNTLGYLLNPLRNRSVLEKWSPYEIAIFEASITLYGKNFHTIQKYIETKTVKEIIEFYYEWKKTNHYKEWKKQYFPDQRDFL